MDCINLWDEVLLGMGISDRESVDLFRNVLVMYDVKPQKLKDIGKLYETVDEKTLFENCIYITKHSFKIIQKAY